LRRTQRRNVGRFAILWTGDTGIEIIFKKIESYKNMPLPAADFPVLLRIDAYFYAHNIHLEVVSCGN
jgi:hypothetical protein